MRRDRYAALGVAGAVSAALALLVGCEELVPTATDASLIPIEPVTVEVVLGFEDFGGDLQVLGGFGSRSDLGLGFLARQFTGSLDARTLVRFASYPRSVSVRDSLGVTRADSALTFLRGRIVLRFDTLRANPSGPITITAAATETAWHAPSATWELAVDTVGDQTAWPTPGGGPAMPVGSAVLNIAESDSVVILVDSATVASWGDTTNAARGVLLAVEDEGVRVEFVQATLRVEARPSINVDTIVDLTAAGRELTFISTPDPDPMADGLRVGGAPAWRSILTIELPDSLRGPPELCALVTCPLELTSERVNQAELVLTTSDADAAFQPSGAILLDVRAVLAPELLPKSPLGASLVGILGQAVLPELFAGDAGETVSLPMSVFVRDLIRGETLDGSPASNTLAVLSTFEPLSVGFGSFVGPGRPGAPQLRLILTISNNLQIP